MFAFQRLIQRRPELNLRLNVVGTVSPDSPSRRVLIAKQAKGKIILHGHVADLRMEALTRRAYATIFVSLAEGYGLPVTESLWHGKPCICSNEGSIAEIAANGGCVAVDPHDPDEIELAVELLATNTDQYNGILQQIAFRRMKTWEEYAGSIVDLLRGYSADGPAAVKLRQGEQREARKPFGEPASSKDRRRSAVLTFSASEFNVHEAYVAGRSRSLRHAGAIRFDRALDGEVQLDVLFYGPYVWLPAGRYSFAFDGEIEGELALSFTADTGVRTIAKVSLRTFDEPIVIELPSSVNKFEIVGSRTSRLERMVLRYVLVGYRAFPQASLGEQETDDAPEPPAPVAAYAADGIPISAPFTIAAEALTVHDAFGAGANNRLRTSSAIVFRAEDHGGVDAPLFCGPYFRLEPGDYRFRFRGELVGPLRVRLTRNLAAECLLESVLTDFSRPVSLRLEHRAEKFEIIGDKTDSTRSMVLREIEVERQELGERRATDGAADAGKKLGRPIALRTDDGRELALPVVWPASAMRVHDAFGKGEANRLRAGDSIAFDAKAHGAVDEQVLFFGPYFHFEPGDYSFRFRGELKGSLGLRFSKNFGAETLLEVEVASFEDPVRVKIESPADKVEIIGRRLMSTRAMTLSAIEISAGEPAARGQPEEEKRNGGKRRRGGIYSRLFGSQDQSAAAERNPQRGAR